MNATQPALASESRFDRPAWSSNAVRPTGVKWQSGDGSGERKLPSRSARVRQKVEPWALVASSRMVSPGRKPLPHSDSEQRKIVARFVHGCAGIAGSGHAPLGSMVTTGHVGRASN